MPPVCTLTGDRTCNLAVCPDWESNPQPFGVGDGTPTHLPRAVRAFSCTTSYVHRKELFFLMSRVLNWLGNRIHISFTFTGSNHFHAVTMGSPTSVSIVPGALHPERYSVPSNSLRFASLLAHTRNSLWFHFAFPSNLQT